MERDEGGAGMTIQETTAEIVRLLGKCNMRQLSLVLRMVRVILK